MSDLTSHPDLDDHSREAISRIENDVTNAIARGNADELSGQLASTISWQHSLEGSIAELQSELKSISSDADDPGILIAFQGMESSFNASLAAAKSLRRRLESKLDAIR